MPDEGAPGIESRRLPPKLIRPRLHHAHRRQRLLHALRQILGGSTAVWICGCPGSGKSTLASTFAEDSGRPCLWYQIDSRDRDPATLFHYLRRAALHVAPRRAVRLPHLTPEYLAGPDAYARRFFDEFFEIIDSDTVLVFDNCQLVADDSLTAKLLAAGLEQAREGPTLIFTSRAPPSAEFARLLAGESLAVIGDEALNLDADEAQAIARERFGPTLTVAQIEHLYRQTRGWAAGFTLLLEQARGAAGGGFTAPPESSEQLFAYFEAEVLSAVPPATLETLLQSAWLPRMPASLLADQCGSPQSVQQIAALCQRNYFVTRTGGGAAVYEYHPLFRDCLLRQARERWSARRLTEVRRRAARLLAADGQSEDALELLIELGDWTEAADQLQVQAAAWLAQGRIPQLEAMLRPLPEEVVATRPWLRYWQAECRLPFDPASARNLFAAALEHFDAAGDGRGSFTAWAGVVDSFVYEWGDFTSLDGWIERFGKLRERYPRFSDAQTEARAVTGIFTALVYRQPQHPELPAWTRRTRELVERSQDLGLRVLIGSRLVAYYVWWSGDLARAASLTAMLQPQVEGGSIDALTAVTWCAIRAMELWMRSRNAECVAMAQRGLDLAEHSGVHVWDFMLLAQAAWGRITAGELDASRELLVRMSVTLTPTRLLDACHYHYQAFTEAMHRDDAAAMFEEADTALRLARQAGVPWAQGIVLPALARALNLRGDIEAAVAAIDESVKLARDCRSGTIAYGALLARTELMRTRDRSREMSAALCEFMALARRHNFTNSSWWRSGAMAELCVAALEQRTEVDFVQQLIRTRRLVPRHPPLHLDDWPWPLRIRTLGHFEVRLDDARLRFEGKSQKRPLALLKLLVAMGGREIPETRLADALWPDAEGDAARQALATALHRMRRLIGTEAVSRHEGRIGLEPGICWVDLWACERQLDLVDEAAAKDPQAAHRALRSALDLYRGPFLDGDPDAGWALPTRERLRNRLLRAVMTTAEALRRAGDAPAAAACYERGLALDDLAEECYRGLMRCHLDGRRSAEGLEVYRRCAERLLQALDVTPSAETERLRRALADR